VTASKERDAEEIADVISRIVGDGENLPAMRRAARAKVEVEFDNEKLDYRLQTLLHSTLEDA